MLNFKKSSKKIPCYVLVFDQLEIIKRHLEFLTENSHKLEIIVIENPSTSTHLIAPYINELGEKGLISRYYLFNENITNNALHVVLDRELEHIRRSKYVMITDGDVVSDDKNWLSEEINVLKRHKNVFTVGISLSLSNLPLSTFPNARTWIPEDKKIEKDYIEAITGTHLELLRGVEFYNLIQWKNQNNIHLVDGSMHSYCYDILNMQWARTKHAEALHLTWDLYLDLDHPYTKLKLGKSLEETWRHSKTSDYKLINFSSSSLREVG